MKPIISYFEAAMRHSSPFEAFSKIQAAQIEIFETGRVLYCYGFLQGHL